MSKADKRLERMRANPKGWRYDEVAAMLLTFGFVTDPKKRGSHRVFKHPSGVRVGLVDAGSGTLLPVYVLDAVDAVDRSKEGR